MDRREVRRGGSDVMRLVVVVIVTTLIPLVILRVKKWI